MIAQGSNAFLPGEISGSKEQGEVSRDHSSGRQVGGFTARLGKVAHWNTKPTKVTA
jgi:hypothetical protein